MFIKYLLNPTDRILNSITTYRFTLYYLIFLLLVAFVGTFLKFIPFGPLDFVLSTATIIFFSFISNYFFAKLSGLTTNFESVFITALILVFIISCNFATNAPFLIVAPVLAMASKYFLTIEKRHIFNPAALGVAAVALLSPDHAAVWWVGTPFMAPFVLLGGLLLTRKLRKEAMVLSFITAYLFFIIPTTILRTASLPTFFTSFQFIFLKSVTLFFAFVMLVEPLTTPVTKKLQICYAIFVAFLYSNFHLSIFAVAVTPEQAIIFGNILTYFINPNYRLLLTLKDKFKLSRNTYAFIFNFPKYFNFVSGQYMEWTLSHISTDSRGNRRYFSLASSPTEQNIMIAVKFYNTSSSYKKNFLKMKKGEKIFASQLAGDFVLPKDICLPLVFIAGGVGITPFRSMLKYIIDKQITVNIVMIYINSTKSDILYDDILSSSEKFGVRTIHVLTRDSRLTNGRNWMYGRLTADMVKSVVPNFVSRKFYISGPQLMVQGIVKMLKETNVSGRMIVKDFFPGYTDE